MVCTRSHLNTRELKYMHLDSGTALTNTEFSSKTNSKWVDGVWSIPRIDEQVSDPLESENHK